jgi:hypothetical protein
MDKQQAFINGVLAQRANRVAEERPHYYDPMLAYFDQGVAHEQRKHAQQLRNGGTLSYGQTLRKDKVMTDRKLAMIIGRACDMVMCQKTLATICAREPQAN